MDKKKFSKITSLKLGVAPLPQSDAPSKKIVATKVTKDLLEIHRDTFLPLLIEVFELRQMLGTYKLQQESPEVRHFGKMPQSPEEILKRLEEIHGDINETLMWCSGALKQVNKTIEEAQTLTKDPV